MQPATLATLAHIALQTGGLALLFVMLGRPLLRAIFASPADRPYATSFVLGGAYFLGMAAFLVAFVLLSRLCGSARLGLWATIAAAVLIAMIDLLRLPLRIGPRSALKHTISCLVLVAWFSATNSALWLRANPTEPSTAPAVMEHFGSIHSGRYANYAIYIAEHDRIPYLAQNVGQSMLASFHLLLGTGAPLAALMAWLPFTLTALSNLLFGVFLNQGRTVAASFGSTFFVLYCNIALSLVHLLVLDNGSPFAFAGYTDFIAGVGTFVLFASWLVTLVRTPRLATPWLPGLLGAFWCWVAPQNVVLASAAVVALCSIGLFAYPLHRALLARRTVLGGSAFVVAVLTGSTQLGALLPKSLREDIGETVYLVEPELHCRPYVLFVATHWTDSRWNRTNGDIYQSEQETGQQQGNGRAIVAVRWIGLLENEIWTSLRLYAFPILGLIAMGYSVLHSKRPQDTDTPERSPDLWFWCSLGTFVAGYSIAFFLEVGPYKWWLMRFLAVGTLLSLIGLMMRLTQPAIEPMTLRRRICWCLCLMIGTFGPLTELGRAFQKNWFRAAHVDPLMHRLDVLVESQGPFGH